VTTIVQQIDAQGPVVVDRIATQFTDVACSAENARKLVQALHGGTSVTLNANGKTATFTPTGNLGYGETYIALALAAEALRSAGVTSCATPEQWQAVLMGGPLNVAGASSTRSTSVASASSSSHFPGVLTLRSQGQGWGQIAQTTNVQLGQVVSGARTSFNVNTSSDTSNLSPTGRSSAEFNQPSSSSSTTGSSASTSGTTSPSSTSTGISGADTSASSSSDRAIKSDDDDRNPGKGREKAKGKAKGHDSSSNDDDDSSSSSSRAGESSSTSRSSSSSSDR
jgi:hypothetical protein